MDVNNLNHDDSEEDDGFTEYATQLLEAYASNKRGNAKLWETINTLKESNDQYASSLATMEKQMVDLVESQTSNENIAVRYHELKDKYDKLETDHHLLISERDDLKNKLLSQKNDIVKEYTDKINVVNEEHSKAVLQMTTRHENKEHEFNIEMHRSQAAAAYKYDERESELLNRIAESNQQLRESNNTNAALRSELLELKSKYQCNLEAAEKNNMKRFQELEERVNIAENELKQSKQTQIKAVPNVRKHTATNRYQFNFSASNKFVRVEQKVTTVSEKNNSDPALKPPVITLQDLETDNSVIKSIYKNNNKIMWPLKPTTKDLPITTVVPNSRTTEGRKRKLYDPDVDYLNPKNSTN